MSPSKHRRIALTVIVNVLLVAVVLGVIQLPRLKIQSPTTAPAQLADVATTSSPSPSASSSASPSASVSPATSPAAVSTTSPSVSPTTSINLNGGGAKNVVQDLNQVDGRLTVRGGVQLNRVPGPSVAPVNSALAVGSCTKCQTFAVALQIDVYSRTANQVTPQNSAVAVNSGCDGCYTVARAIQYVLPVDDPTQVPPDVQALITQMRTTLDTIQADPNISLPDAEARINAVTAQFQELASGLNDQRDQSTDTTSPNAGQFAALTP